MLTKQEAKKIVEQTKGEARGVAFKDDLDFILDLKGKSGLKKVESRMAELGCPLKYKEIKTMGFYSLGLEVVMVMSIQEVFNFSEEEIKRWGASIVKFSFFIKIFMKYFASLELISRQVPSIWRRYYTVGDLEMPEYSEKKRYVILRLKNFKMSPVHCQIYKGFFPKVTEMVVKNPTKCKETKCMFRGDPYHEFLITW